MAILPKQQVLADTSFLVTVFDRGRDNHENAKKYYRYFLDNKIVIRLSTIVVAEFQQKQSIADIINTGNFMVLPFNYEHAIVTADIAHRLGKTPRSTESTRAEYRDDIKLMAQAQKQSIEFIVTEDVKTLAKYCRRLKEANMFQPKAIVVAEGFEPAHFNQGQKSFMDAEQGQDG